MSIRAVKSRNSLTMMIPVMVINPSASISAIAAWTFRFLRTASPCSNHRWSKNVRKVYPVLYIDAIHYSVYDNGIIRKLAAYEILGINQDGNKKVLTLEVSENDSSKYWLSVLNSLKNRGVKDILIICAGGFSGIKEAITAVYPKTEYQRCVVHQVRNTMKYVSDKDRKPFCADLKTIYQALMEEKALDAIFPIFKLSTEVRKVIIPPTPLRT